MYEEKCPKCGCEDLIYGVALERNCGFLKLSVEIVQLVVCSDCNNSWEV